MKRQKLRRQKDRCCSGWGRKWQEMVFQYNRNHAKILWSGTIHTSERKILFGALPGCCWSIDSCLTDPWLVRFCFVSLISQWHSFQLRISLKLGKHNQCFQVVLCLRVHFFAKKTNVVYAIACFAPCASHSSCALLFILVTNDGV